MGHAITMYADIDRRCEQSVRATVGDSYGWDYSSGNDAQSFAQLFRAASNVRVVLREAVAEAVAWAAFAAAVKS